MDWPIPVTLVALFLQSMAAQPSRHWAHGRLMLGSPQLNPSIESVIEGVFVATFTQRFFARQ
jgi:hypothetical protein